MIVVNGIKLCVREDGGKGVHSNRNQREKLTPKAKERDTTNIALLGHEGVA